MPAREKKRPFIEELVRLWPGLPYLGLGVWLAWSLLAYSGTFWLSDTAIDGRHISSLYLLSMGVSAVLMLLSPFLHGFMQNLLARPVWVYLGAGLVSLGSLCVVFAGPYYLGFRWLFFVGAAMTGIGAVPVTFKCAQLYSGLSPGKVVVYVVLSQLLVAILYFFFLGAASYAPVAGGPSLSGIIGLTILPVLSAFLITVPAMQSASANGLDDTAESPLAKPRLKPSENGLKNIFVTPGFWKLCVAVLFFSIVTSVVQGLTVHSLSPAENMSSNNLEMLLWILCAVAFLYFMLRLVKQQNFGKFYLVLMVGIAAVLPLASSLQFFGGAFKVFVSLALSTFDMLLWCLLAFIVQRRGVSFIVVFGFGRGAFVVGGVIGWLLGARVIPLVSVTLPSSVIFVFLSTLVLVSALVIFSEKDFDLLFSSVFVGRPDAQQVSVSKGGLDPFDKKEYSQPRERPYLKACEYVGSAAHLSKREQDVLKLLAQSRGSDDIARRLNISNNTVRTHTHNIYSKLNVHSRQELIEIVEEAWMGDKGTP